MREYVYVEFLFNQHTYEQGEKDIAELGDDFVLLKSALEYDHQNSDGYKRVVGKINSSTATAIKLGNTILSNSMRISYIPAQLKDRYRNR